MSGAIIRFRNEAFSSEGMLATIVARNSQTEEYTNYAYSTLCAIRKPALKKGGHKFMTLLPSFNKKETWIEKQIPTYRDNLITDVKWLRYASPKFFLTSRRSMFTMKENAKIYSLRVHNPVEKKYSEKTYLRWCKNDS